MTTYKIQLLIIDNRFCNSGPIFNRKTIRRGTAANDELAMIEAQTICGVFDEDIVSTITIKKKRNGIKYRTWYKVRTLHKEFKFSSNLIVTFTRELGKI